MADNEKFRGNSPINLSKTLTTSLTRDIDLTSEITMIFSAISLLERTVTLISEIDIEEVDY